MTRARIAAPVLALAVVLLAAQAASARSADMSVTAGDSPDPVQFNGSVTIEATTTNKGPDSVNLEFFIDVSPLLTLRSIAATGASAPCTGPSPGAMAGGRYRCLSDPRQPGQTMRVTITADATSGGAAKSVLSVQDGSADKATDPQPGDNTAEVTTSVVGDPAQGGDPGGEEVRFRRLALVPSAFRAAASGPAVARAPVGTRVSFRLTGSAPTVFSVQRRSAGRRSKGRCVAPNRRNRRARGCIRWARVKGTFKRPAAATGRFRFRGRMRGRALKPGRYRLVALPRLPEFSPLPTYRRFRIVR